MARKVRTGMFRHRQYVQCYGCQRRVTVHGNCWTFKHLCQQCKSTLCTHCGQLHVHQPGCPGGGSMVT